MFFLNISANFVFNLNFSLKNLFNKKISAQQTCEKLFVSVLKNSIVHFFINYKL